MTGAGTDADRRQDVQARFRIGAESSWPDTSVTRVRSVAGGPGGRSADTPTGSPPRSAGERACWTGFTPQNPRNPAFEGWSLFSGPPGPFRGAGGIGPLARLLRRETGVVGEPGRPALARLDWVNPVIGILWIVRDSIGTALYLLDSGS